MFLLVEIIERIFPAVQTRCSASRPCQPAPRAALLPLPMLLLLVAGDGAAVARARRSLPVPGARDHDLDAVRARLQPAARATPACRRSATAPSSASAPTRSACCSCVCGPISGSTWLARRSVARSGRRAGRAVHLAPARHLLRAADDRLRPDLLVRRDQVAQRHRRRGRPAQDQAAAGRFRLRLVRSRRQRGALLLRASASSCWSCVALWRLVHSPFGRVLTAIKQNETRAALRRLQRLALQVARLHALGGGRRDSPARCSRWRSSRPIPNVMSLHQSGFVVMMDADRRRPGQLLGAGDRRAVLHPRARPARRVHRRRGCSGTGCCSWRWCCSSPRASPAWQAWRRAHRPVAPALVAGKAA